MIRPNALFSSSDFTALGAIQELQSRGINIPEDFGVVGLSNEPFTQYMELSMTTIDQSPLEMGQLAAKVFLEQVESNEVEIQKKIVLKPELVVRKSSNR